jgi:hypothetical protein
VFDAQERNKNLSGFLRHHGLQGGQTYSSHGVVLNSIAAVQYPPESVR